MIQTAAPSLDYTIDYKKVALHRPVDWGTIFYRISSVLFATCSLFWLCTAHMCKVVTWSGTVNSTLTTEGGVDRIDIRHRVSIFIFFDNSRSFVIWHFDFYCKQKQINFCTVHTLNCQKLDGFVMLRVYIVVEKVQLEFSSFSSAVWFYFNNEIIRWLEFFHRFTSLIPPLKSFSSNLGCSIEIHSKWTRCKQKSQSSPSSRFIGWCQMANFTLNSAQTL